MPRTALNIYPLPLFVHTADPTPDAIDATNGMVLSGRNPSRILFRIKNTAVGAKNITIKAGVRPPAMNPFDTVATYGAGETRSVWAAPGDRHSQANGDIYIEFEAGTTGQITAFILPLGL